MKILIIGSSSFAYSIFKKQCSSDYFFLEIARRRTGCVGEIIVPDFFDIDPECFYGVDVVMNFAAIVHRPEIRDTLQYDVINNELSVLNAKKSKQAGVKHFIQMSSVAVYGLNTLIDDSTQPEPITPYGMSKLRADLALQEMQDEKFCVSIIRPSMVYGGGNAPGNMMRLIKLVDKGIPLPFREVDNCRDFVNVHNLSHCLDEIIAKRLSGVFLVSDGESVSTEFLLKTIGRCLGKKTRLFRLPRVCMKFISLVRPSEYIKLFGSLSISANFPSLRPDNWQSVEQGISEMVQWYKSKSINKK